MTKDWLDKYFNDEKPFIDLVPIKVNGTDFCMKVWNIIKTIPYGQTITYGEIASIIAKEECLTKMSAQAVSYAIGHNPVPIIIPCHRVVGAKGNLVGYGGGLDIKIKLLEHEHVDMHNFYIPKKGNKL